MLKTFFTFIFSFLLFFYTASYADETPDVQEESTIEDVLPTEEVAEENTEPQDTQEQKAQEEVSEAQREADAAEAAELQEVGEGEEPSAE